MNKYVIENLGCDDSTSFTMDLTNEELQLIIRFIEENNKGASYCCIPNINIYKYDEKIGPNAWNYHDVKPLNRDYDELKKGE